MPKKQNKTVLTFGTFDIFHPGHIHYLASAKKHGDTLITVIARDDTVKRIKGTNPRNHEDIRKKVVEESGIVDTVVLGSLDSPYLVLETYTPDVLCFGYDQKSFNNPHLTKKLEEIGLSPEIIQISALKPDVYKSSKM